MFRQSCKLISLGILVVMLLTVPAGAVPTFKVSNYGGGHQIWFEAEDFDERNPPTEAFFPVVDHEGAFGKTVSRAGSEGMIRWTFDISAAGGKGGTWYFFGRVFNPNNRSDYLLVEGDPGDAVIPTGPPFPGGNEAGPFTNADDQIFEETNANWAWVRSGHQGGHTKQLKDGKNTMYIFRREGNNTVFWDVFVWADNPAYRPTDDDYRNAKVYLPGKATDASPTGTDVPLDAVLSWAAGAFAGKHDVYFGTDSAAVTQATTTADPAGVYKGRIDATTYTVPLAFGQTYYWRIDEVNKTPDNAIFTGNVWSFTVEPYAYSIRPATATASNAQPNMGPEKTIDGSGLTGDLHGTVETTMWLSDAGLPAWIQYEFDKAYKLQEMQVWNSNQTVEVVMGYGAKQVTVETSLDGVTWTPVADVPQFAQAPTPATNSAATTVVNLGPVDAKYVKLTINSNWGGLLPWTGLSEVRFSHIPVQARLPQPADGAKDVSVEATLDWRPGRAAASHKVFLSTDRDAVANGTAAAQTVATHGYAPDALNYGTTYYWKVDEVNAVAYPGDVWSFTTQKYLVVDDFESYTAEAGAEVFSSWLDGFDNPAQNGAVVGLATAVNGTFCDTTVFHGGKASMPFAYSNTGAPVSEATLTFAPAQDWTARGLKGLSFWFRGAADNTGKLYVKINNTKVPYAGDAGDIAKSGWTVWSIDLSTVAAGVNKVTKLAIGVEGAGAKGTLHVDDVQLSPTVLVPITQPVITAVVRANGQAGTRTDASPVKTYTESTAPASMPPFGLMDGAFVFSDRVFTWTNTPPALVGAEYILGFNQDKSAGETDVTYTVTFGRAATVFIGSDDRFRPNQQATVDAAVAAFAKPGQFKDTGLKLYYHDGTNLLSVSVFTADLPAGTYVFGSQVGNCFYTIGVMPK